MLPRDMDNLFQIASTNWFYYFPHGFQEFKVVQDSAESGMTLSIVGYTLV
jgi:hypothetical protein